MDGKRVLYEIRKQGFRIELDDSGKPTIEPRRELSLEQREMLKRHKFEIRKALEEEKAATDLLTPFDVPSFEELAEWWLAWTPPAESYELQPGVVVSDPQKSWEYHAELVQKGEECRGGVKLALYSWMRRHWLKFAAKEKSKVETKSS